VSDPARKASATNPGSGRGAIVREQGAPTVEAVAVLAALRDIGAGIDSYRQAMAVQAGLVTADLIAIGLLHQDEPLRAGQIGERTGLTPGSVTALLNRLESRGYLTRVRPDHNRRSLQVSLTPAGRTLGDALVANLLPALSAIVEDIGPSECAAVLGVLERITTALTTIAAYPGLGEEFVGPDPA
jgi:DNA-binding MarR family transcriptional regulator